MRPPRQSGPSQRQLRVAEQLKHIIAETMQRGHFGDSVLLDAAGITVSEVRTTPDLKNATAYVMSLGGQDMDRILPALNENAHVFQKEIGRQGATKFTPRVKFKLDETFGEVQRIEDILRSVHIPKDDPEDSAESE